MMDSITLLCRNSVGGRAMFSRALVSLRSLIVDRKRHRLHPLARSVLATAALMIACPSGTAAQMQRLQFTPAVEAGGVARATLRGKSARGAQLASFRKTYPMAVGSFNYTDQDLKSGSIYQRPEYIPVDAKEIVRCTCLSMRRRRQ